jgi:hypothetical protein
MTAFDYAARVDLFVGRGSFSHRRPLEYKPFPCASAAIRYAMEELSPEQLGGICLVADELRFDGDGIRKLYESEAYPLERKKTSRRSVRPVADAAPVVPNAAVRQ